MSEERITDLEKRVRELEACCERLRVYVDELDKRKADRTVDRPPVCFDPQEVPHFEGKDVTLGRQRQV